MPLVLVGNKCDINSASNHLVCEKAHKFAQDVLKCPYFETSAKDNKNVQNCFKKAVELINQLIESSVRRESVNAANEVRRNSTMSFVRRISISASPKRTMFERRFSEPVVCNNDPSSKKRNNIKHLDDERHRKKSKNCIIS